MARTARPNILRGLLKTRRVPISMKRVYFFIGSDPEKRRSRSPAMVSNASSEATQLMCVGSLK